MSNSEKFNFRDFTHDHYKDILSVARNRFSFATYENFHTLHNFVLWRHDVDLSLHAAEHLARIECDLNTFSTYFLLPHSEYYNLLETSIYEIVCRIRDMGHHIGLHFDPNFYQISPGDRALLERCLQLEKHFLEEVFRVRINVFSFHNPTSEMFQFDDDTYAGMINVYSADFRDSVKYCSDSNGYWRHKRLIDVLKDDSIQKLQVLTHPEWWTRHIMSPKEKVWRVIDGRAANLKEHYVETIRSYNREIIDW